MENYNSLISYLEEITDSMDFEKFIKPCKFVNTINDIIMLGIPNRNIYMWFVENIYDKALFFVKDQFNMSLKIIPLFNENDNNEEYEKEITKEKKIISNINKNMTFKNFHVCPNNNMAYAFSYNVTDFPGMNYNPLYIYGDVGFGKTHLMHAIGNRLEKKHKNIQILYLTTEDLMNDYVLSTRINKRHDFIEKYTNVDALLIDDIQYITRWEGTSEQFFYILNKLIENQKQIVLCADKHPDNIPDLPSRIKSRFEMGGMADIAPYDLESRIAIIKDKIEKQSIFSKEKFIIPDEVIYFIASSVTENIRILIGALKRLIGLAELKLTSGDIITKDFTKEALLPYLPKNNQNISIESIQEYIATIYDISVNDLKSKTNRKIIVEPRQISMYLSKKLTDKSLKEIGEFFGGKDHSTVLHSINKIKKKMLNDNEFSKKVESFVKNFK